MARMTSGKEVRTLASVDDKLPDWWRISADDHMTPEAMSLIGDGRDGGWADYGRWVVLRSILARTPGALIDVTNTMQSSSLARQLDLRGKGRLHGFLEGLAECGAIDRDDWEKGVVSVYDITNAQIAYVQTCERNRRNIQKRYRK